MGRRKKMNINSPSDSIVDMNPEGCENQATTQSGIPPSPRLNISRVAYSVKEFQDEFEVVPPAKPSVKEKCLKSAKKMFACSPTNFIQKRIPFFGWVPKYNFREYMIADLIAGITIAVFVAPQCMGYSLIAHVPPVHGLYSGFFPTLVYAFLGTSRHSAVGGEVMLSGVMTGNIVLQILTENGMSLHEIENQIHESGPPGRGTSSASESEPESDSSNNLGSESTTPTTTIDDTVDPLSNVHTISDLKSADIASAIGFIMGIVFPIMSVLKLGFVSIYLSEQFLSGCITAASVYAVASQLRYMFGVHLPYRSGYFAVVMSFVDVALQWKQINITCVIISIVAMAVLLLCKIYFNPWLLKKKYGFNFPIELIVVIFGTLFSYLFNFSQVYGVPTVGRLPAGIPPPQVPKMSVLRAVGLRTIPCMLYSFTISLSIGKLYGAKHGYEVDPNQELIALGGSNILGSIFTSIPASASLPRSATQEAAGGKTQITSLVNCVIMLFLLLYLSPLLSDLPNCILSAIITIALRSLLAKIRQFYIYWKISKIDACVWLVTFCAIIALDMELGLYLSLAWSLLILIYKSSRPKTYLLGSVNKSDVYVPLNKFMDAKEMSGIRIYQFCGPLHFASFEYFKTDLLKKIAIDMNELMALKEKDIERKRRETRAPRSIEDRVEPNYGTVTPSWSYLIENCRIVIIDCSMLSYIDTSGVASLKSLASDFKSVGIKFFLASCAPHVITMLSKDRFFSVIGQNHVFISVHDAVLVAVGYVESYNNNNRSTASPSDSLRPIATVRRNGTKERYRQLNDS